MLCTTATRHPKETARTAHQSMALTPKSARADFNGTAADAVGIGILMIRTSGQRSARGVNQRGGGNRRSGSESPEGPNERQRKATAGRFHAAQRAYVGGAEAHRPSLRLVRHGPSATRCAAGDFRPTSGGGVFLRAVPEDCQRRSRWDARRPPRAEPDRFRAGASVTQYRAQLFEPDTTQERVVQCICAQRQGAEEWAKIMASRSSDPRAYVTVFQCFERSIRSISRQEALESIGPNLGMFPPQCGPL